MHAGKYAEGIAACEPVIATARAKHDRMLEMTAL
jgi:hypothetical protein